MAARTLIPLKRVPGTVQIVSTSLLFLIFRFQIMFTSAFLDDKYLWPSGFFVYMMVRYNMIFAEVLNLSALVNKALANAALANAALAAKLPSGFFYWINIFLHTRPRDFFLFVT